MILEIIENLPVEPVTITLSPTSIPIYRPLATCSLTQLATKVSEIKAQLAFFQFNAPMVEKIQWTMQPLQALTSPNSNWRSLARSRPLPEKAMKAWLELKRILLSEPCIAWPDTSLPF